MRKKQRESGVDSGVPSGASERRERNNAGLKLFAWDKPQASFHPWIGPGSAQGFVDPKEA